MSILTKISPRVLLLLVSLQILIITMSNYLVQIPVEVFGFFTTWGAFSYPLVFLVTDLTVRLLGQNTARIVIFCTMIPALLISYFFSTAFYEGKFTGLANLFVFDMFIFRIVIASFIAYVVSQLLDIFVFSKLRALPQWWPAPIASTFIGTIIDSVIFFTIAFYQSSNPEFAENWVEYGTVDYVFKLGVSLLVFVPAYGVVLSALQKRLSNAK